MKGAPGRRRRSSSRSARWAEVGETTLAEIDRFHQGARALPQAALGRRGDSAEEPLGSPAPDTQALQAVPQAHPTISATTRREPRGTALWVFTTKVTHPLDGARSAARRGDPGRAGHLVDPHAAALRARPHQPVDPRGRRRLHAGRHRATASQATLDLWEKHFAGVMAGRPVKNIVVTHYHPDHVGSAGWLVERTGAPLWMTTAEYLSAHAARDDFGGLRSRQHAWSSTSRNGLDLASIPETTQQGQGLSPRRAGDAQALPPHDARRQALHRRPRLGSDHRVRPRARARRALVRVAERAHLRRPGAAAHHARNVGVWGNQPEANPLDALPRPRSGASRTCPPMRSCCLRTSASSADCTSASPSCTSTTSGASSACSRAAPRRSPRSRRCRSSSSASSTTTRLRSPWARRSRTCITSARAGQGRAPGRLARVSAASPRQGVVT